MSIDRGLAVQTTVHPHREVLCSCKKKNKECLYRLTKQTALGKLREKKQSAGQHMRYAPFCVRKRKRTKNTHLCIFGMRNTGGINEKWLSTGRAWNRTEGSCMGSRNSLLIAYFLLWNHLKVVEVLKIKLIKLTKRKKPIPKN